MTIIIENDYDCYDTETIIYREREDIHIYHCNNATSL